MAEAAEENLEDSSPKSSRSVVWRNAKFARSAAKQSRRWLQGRGHRGCYNWEMEGDVGDRMAEDSPVTVAN